MSADLVDRAYAAILDAICDGRLAAGARVTQEDLARRLDVSRQPVMQAMALLRREGFLVEAGRRGLQVAPLEPARLRDLYELRAALDAMAARLAAARAAPAARARGPALIAAGRAAAAAADAPALIAADQAFHAFIYDLSGNALITQILSLRWHDVRRAMAAFLSSPPRFAPVWDEHAAILDAIAAGDADTAERLARHHALDAADAIVGRLPDATAARPA